MNSRTKILSIGLLWGWLEASLLYLAFLVPTIFPFDIPNSFFSVVPRLPAQEGLFFAAVISLVAGILLADSTNDMKSLLIATLIATVVAVLASITVFASIPISLFGGHFLPLQPGDENILFYGVLAPILFIIGFLMSTAGSVFGNWRAEKRQRRLHPLRPLPAIDT